MDKDSSKKELRRVEKRLSEIAFETSNIFLLQGQMTMDEGALQLASERLSEVAKEKETLLKYKGELVEVGIQAESYEDPSEFLRDSIADFNKGFKKAPETLKRRLLRETIQQLVLTSEGLAIWYYLADAKVPGNKLQLVKELKRDLEGNETENLFLMPRASGDHSNLQILRSVIGKNGDPSFPITERFQPIDFIPLSFPDVARVSTEVAQFYQEGLSLQEVSARVGFSKTRVRNHLIKLGVELRPKLFSPTATGWRKSGKQAVRPFYGFSYHQGKVARDPKEFSVLLLIHEKWKQGVNANSIATYLNANKIPSRCNKVWSWNAVKNMVDRFESKKIVIKPGGKYEFR